MPSKNNYILLIAFAIGGLIIVFLILQLYVASDQQAKAASVNALVEDQKTADRLFAGLQSSEPSIVKSSTDALDKVDDKQKVTVLEDMLAIPVVTPGDKNSHLMTLKYVVEFQKALEWTPELEARMDKEQQSHELANKECWIEYVYVHKNDHATARNEAVQIMNGGDPLLRIQMIQYIIDHYQTFWPEFKKPFQNYVAQYKHNPPYKDSVDLAQHFLDLDSKGLVLMLR